MDKIELSFEFVEKYVRFANPQYIQVYLYTKYLLNHNDEMPNAETVAAVSYTHLTLPTKA